MKTLELAYGEGVNDPADWRRPGVRVLAYLSNSTEGTQVHIPSYDPEFGPNYEQSFYVVNGEDLV